MTLRWNSGFTLDFKILSMDLKINIIFTSVCLVDTG